MYCKRNIRRAGSPWLVGTDIVGEFGRWYRSGEILDRFEVLVYPRGTEPDSVSDERFTFLKDVPTIPVVATDIRARIRRGENPADDLPPGVWEYTRKTDSMDTPDETIRRIEELDRAIGRTPEQSALYMRRGRLLYRAGLFHRR